MFKLLDPVAQSLGIIFFIYCLDAHTHIPYKWVLLVLIGWQLLSVLINFFFWNLKLLKIERILFLVSMVVYLGIFSFIERNVQENFVPLDAGLKPTVPMNRVILMTVGVIIAFWYTVICYREFRKMFGAINTGRGR